MRLSLSFSFVLFFIVTNLYCLLLSFSIAYEITSTKNLEGTIVESPVAPAQNALQKHVAFFDRNHDGIIYPWETFQGFRAIGFGIFLSTAAANFINTRLSLKTRPTLLNMLPGNGRTYLIKKNKHYINLLANYKLILTKLTSSLLQL
ncbi:putative plant seed peroxygenase [Lupinus albus]|uniref:Putative plant seed peroxygenase n=1 Tax=Lupinus albus TaxID=3870 RepID=A0A6A4PUY9_LUPAL|nr:putative plant seed peroxygenase [Lupinus albus]